MVVAVAAATAAVESCNRGVLLGMKRVWPPFVGYGHGRTEVEEEAGAAAKEEISITGAVEGEAVSDWDEESIAEGRESFLIYLGLWYQVENNRMT